MPTNLLLAPVGSGKTEVALDRLVQTITAKPFAKVWVLLATTRQEEVFRQRLVEYDAARRVYFNVEFFNFYDLYERVLDTARQPQRRLNDTARYGLLRAIITDLKAQGQLSFYQRIAHTPGFVRVVADLIYELKQNRVYPDRFAKAAQSRKDKDRELSLIYSTYQQRLQAYNLVDREGEGWLALAVLEVLKKGQLASDVDLLLVDGYDQFTPVQADLLTVLARRAADTLITLTTVPEREDTIGRRFKQALDRLEQRHKSGIVRLPAQPSGESRHADLHHLADTIFRSSFTPRPASGGVVLIEAPDPAQEVRAVLRRVKRLLLTEAARPDEVLIALRDWQLYQSQFTRLAHEYGVPLALHYGEPLAQNPAIIALLNLLELPDLDFHRRELLDALRSPYFKVPGLDRSQVDWLERISQEFVVTGGSGNWLEAIERASQPTRDDDHETETHLLDETQAQQLSGALATFFDALKPPPEATVEFYISWLEKLIGPDPVADEDDDSADDTRVERLFSLEFLEQVRQSDDDRLLTRDLAALYEFKRLLRGLISAQELLATLQIGGNVTWETFMTDLKAAIAAAASTPRMPRTGRVLVTTAADARGLPHDHVFILGLSEGVFPAQASEDLLYLDSERRELKAAGIELLTQDERAADDGVFYELISLPRRSLTLSRPTVQDGKPWIESHLWRAVAAIFSELPVQHIAPGAVVPAEDVASLPEAALAAAHDLSRPADTLTAGWLVDWLRQNHATYWAHLATARAVESGRFSTMPFDRYSGRLQHPDLIAKAAEALGVQHRWSASQLRDYGVCGFRFFAKRLLQLEALEEPEEGLDIRTLGTLNHAILEKTYRALAQQGIAITPDTLDRALALLDEKADEELRDAPRRLGFHPTVLWEQEKRALRSQLTELVRLDFSESSPVGQLAAKSDGLPNEGTHRLPYGVEIPFGLSGEPPVKIDVGDGVDPLYVVGYIDRIDRQGDSLVVVDYKTGSTEIKTDEMVAGRDFQMMIYLLAAQELARRRGDFGSPPRVAGLFWHLRNRKISGAISTDDEEAIEQINTARAHLARYIEQGRAGNFAVQPNKPDQGRCIRYCEFYQLCRMSSTHRRKQ